MEQRDLVKDEIERLGRALGKILADFLRLKSEGKVMEAIEMATHQLTEELDIDIERIIGESEEGTYRFFGSRKFTAAHLEDLSEYLTETGQSQLESEPEVAKQKLQKAIQLLDIADRLTKTVSFDRMDRRAGIQRLLK